jgi:hypothetical protein
LGLIGGKQLGFANYEHTTAMKQTKLDQLPSDM